MICRIGLHPQTLLMPYIAGEQKVRYTCISCPILLNAESATIV